MKKAKAIDLYKQELELLLSMPQLVMEQRKWTQKQYDIRVQEVRDSIEASKSGRMKRNKGSRYERAVAKIFKGKLGVELTRTPQSGGFAKKSEKAEEFRGDIVSLDPSVDLVVHIECKDHKTWKPKEWYEQAKSDCPKGKVPIVVMHRAQKNENGKRVETSEDFVMLKLSDFLDLAGNSIVRRKLNVKKTRRSHRNNTKS